MLARGLGGAKHFRAANPPGGTMISYYLKPASSSGSPNGNSPVRLTISNLRGTVVRELTGTNEPGINRVLWNLAPNPPPGGEGRGGGFGGGRGGRGGGPSFVVGNAVEPGTYVVKVAAGGKELTTTVLVEADSIR
jgi:hypothetical protein